MHTQFFDLLWSVNSLDQIIAARPLISNTVRPVVQLCSSIISIMPGLY